MEKTQDGILDQVKRIHFVGIGGSGMSPLVEILHTMGYTITGSDNNESDNVNRLRRLGVTVHMGHDAVNVGDAQLVVYTAAVQADNPELLEAARRQIPTRERAKLLGLISRRYANTIAVAGTHGKTTTSSMLSQILLEAGKDPSVFIGGRLPLIDANGRAGQSDMMVCEACEFQDHYLEMRPAVSIILNVDADHLDYFGSLENVIRSFHNFAERTSRSIIYNRDDPHTCAAVAGLTHEQELISCGLSDDCDWQAKNITFENGSYGVYDLWHNGTFVTTVRLGVPGKHNIYNSLTAAAAATLYGVTPEQLAEGMAHFGGAGRRFEKLGTFGGVTIVDDYAHHPTEIAATLRTAMDMGFNRVWAVFQPFTFSRTVRHLEEFAEALAIADRVVVSDIMGSREINSYGVHSTQITDRIEGGVYRAGFPEITEYVTTHAVPGDLVVTMGGGDIYKCARMIRDKLNT
ncbi:MAG: UDP-N-acetylmuramate--L-alanine ligase [Clostridia bacterium]|nr:UDP-N-acetylmuramate--L-alanine ligase [Clostridia bacterium]